MKQPHIYKITNKLNKKFYYGVHNGNQTDSYMGSGKILKDMYKKYPSDDKNVWSKEILLKFDSTKEAYEYEAVIVNEKMLANPLCMNIKPGGDGGFTKECSIAGGKATAKKFWTKEHQSKAGKKGGGSKSLVNGKTYMNKQKKQCPHCPMACNPGLYSRYHGDMCKHNPLSVRYKGGF